MHVADLSRQRQAGTIAAADPCGTMCRQEEDEEDEDSVDDEENSETQIWIRSIGKLAAGKLCPAVMPKMRLFTVLVPQSGCISLEKRGIMIGLPTRTTECCTALQFKACNVMLVC